MLPVGVPRQVTFVVACRFPKNPALSRVSDPKRLYFCTVIGRPEAVRSADRPACELQCRWSRGPEGLRRRLQPAVSARLLCIHTASECSGFSVGAANFASELRKVRPRTKSRVALGRARTPRHWPNEPDSRAPGAPNRRCDSGPGR